MVEWYDGIMFFAHGLFGASVFLIISLAPILLGVKWALRKGVSPHWMWLGGVTLYLGWIAFAIIRLIIKPKQVDASSDPGSELEIARRQKALWAGTIVIMALSTLYIGTPLFLWATFFYTSENTGFFMGFSVGAVAVCVHVYLRIRQLRKENRET